jgi:hypothetical protein
MDAILNFNFERFAGIAICLTSGVLFRITLSMVGQRWVRTYHHTMTYMLLPVTALVVTKVISGNIALSLGMIGALSIVRFRNPVKNPLELVIFFALLTIGIAAGVANKWAIFLTAVCIFVFLGIHLFDKFVSSKGSSLFSLSFDEGNPLHLVEVAATNPLDDLSASPALQYSSYLKNENTYSYKLAYRTRDEAIQVDQYLRSRDDVTYTQVRFVNTV